MTNAEIVSKLWNLCNVLRDDGITYHQYVTELTYILFLKMAKETGAEKNIPEQYRWDVLKVKEGMELKRFYDELLRELGENGTGRVQEIYQGARSNIEEPANLKKIITNIDELDWYSAKEEGLGNLYEGLLEKNANEKKSGAGQYFTPRVLIDVMTELIAPQPGERCNDPACGTFGFSFLTLGIGFFKCFIAISTAVSPLKGIVPASISYIIIPREYISDLIVDPLPLACSGGK